MGIRGFNMDRRSWHGRRSHEFVMPLPPDRDDALFPQNSLPAATGPITIVGTLPAIIPNTSVAFAIGEAAAPANDVSATFSVVGKDHMGSDVTESLTVDTIGANDIEMNQTVTAWSQVSSVTMTALANRKATDILAIGLVYAANSYVGTLAGIGQPAFVPARIGLPCYLSDVSDNGPQLVRLKNGNGGDVALSNIDVGTQTATMASLGAPTLPRNLIWVVDRNYKFR